MSNPKFNALLRDMQAMHDKKAADYAAADNRYSNFEFAGMVAQGFTRPVDIAFATLIGVKLARLAELKGKGKTPRNESLQDTMLDLAVYAALWASYDYPVEAKAPDLSEVAMKDRLAYLQADADYAKREVLAGASGVRVG